MNPIAQPAYATDIFSTPPSPKMEQKHSGSTSGQMEVEPRYLNVGSWLPVADELRKYVTDGEQPIAEHRGINLAFLRFQNSLERTAASLLGSEYFRYALLSDTELVDIAAFDKQDFVFVADTPSELAREISEKVKDTRKAVGEYTRRIAELISDAALDGIALNKASERDFWAFLRAQGFFRKGSLFLLDNGNLRAVWKTGKEDQIGLQFLGDEKIQFVIFKYRPEKQIVVPHYGRDTLDGIRSEITALDLDDLIAI